MESILRWLILLLVPFLALSFGGVQKWAFTTMQLIIFAIFPVWTLTRLYEKKKDSRFILPHDHLLLFIAFVPFIFFILFQASPIPEVFIRLISHGLFDLKERIGFSGAVKFPSSLSINRYETFAALFQVTSCFLTVIITSILFRNKKHLKIALYFIAFTGFAISLFGIMQYLSWNGKIYWTIPISSGAPFGPFINHNHFAAFANMTVLPLLALVLYQYKEYVRIKAWRGKDGYILFLSLVITIMAIFISGSRGGVVSLIAGVIVMLFILRREGEVKVNLFLLSIILSSVTGLFFIINRWEVLDTLSSLLTAHEDISLLYRLKGWEAAMQIFKDFPVAGTGMGTFSDIFLVYRPESMLTTFRHAHNEYMQFMTEGGWVGLLLVLIPLVYFVMKFNPVIRDDYDRELRYVRTGIFSCMIALLIHNTLEFNMRVPANAYLFSFMLGLYLTLFDKKSILSRAAQRRIFCGLFLISMTCLVFNISDVVHSYNFDGKSSKHLVNSQSLVPYDPQDLVRRGGFYAARKMHPQAEEYFLSALHIGPLDASIWTQYSASLERKGALDEAIRSLGVASKLDPVNATYRFHLAGLRLENGDTLNAINELKKLVETRSGWFNRALELAKDANIDSNSLIDMADNRPERLVVIGRMYEREGSYESATQSYRKAVRLKPLDQLYLDIYAGFMMRQREYESLKTIDAIYSESIPARAMYWKSEGFFASGDVGEGAKLLSGLIERGDQYLIEYGERLASLFLNIKDFEKTLNLMERLVSLDGEDYNRLNLMSLAYEGSGRWMKAVNSLKKMSILKPASFSANYRLALLYERQGMNALVASELEKCLDIQPDNFKVRLKLGDIYFAMNKTDKALYHYRNILALDPTNSIVLSRLNRF